LQFDLLAAFLLISCLTYKMEATYFSKRLAHFYRDMIL
jgi:hypothetical protein